MPVGEGWGYPNPSRDPYRNLYPASSSENSAPMTLWDKTCSMAIITGTVIGGVALVGLWDKKSREYEEPQKAQLTIDPQVEVNAIAAVRSNIFQLHDFSFSTAGITAEERQRIAQLLYSTEAALLTVDQAEKR